MVVTIAVESDEARAAVEAASDGRLLLVPRLDGRYSRIGTVAKVESRLSLPNGQPALVVRGESRAHVGAGVVGTGEALWVQAEPVATDEPSERVAELAREYRATARALLAQFGGRRVSSVLGDVDDPGALADTAGWIPDLALERKVTLLETVDVEARLELALGWAKDALAELELAEQIRNDVTEGMEKTQREFLLRQQLAAIRKELGEDGDDDPVADYRERFADRDLPDDVAAAVDRELGKLERTSAQSAEYGWIRAWLDTVAELPWGERSADHLDLTEARAVLDADHTGLDDVKQRVVEFLAVRKLRAERGIDADGGRKAGAIIALVGPPGVGKTSLGESIARALDRSFVRVALGGVRDEAEIRGHRRTYVGAQPGRIVRALAEAGTMNPVFLLDEIDKVGSDWRGDPSSALLEVLDPAQNHSFRDHYLEVDLDLSDVLFVATANVLDTIPGPLLDRVEIVRLDGYTEDEKVAIARDHLVARQLERNGLRPDEVVFDEDALRTVIADYTMEPGVRDLERQLGKVLRKAATTIAGGDAPGAEGGDDPDVTIGVDDLRPALGRARFPRDDHDRRHGPGVATGLAVTGAGGDVLSVEATALDGDTGLKVTGQLGDVMSESAEIAFTYVQANREALGIHAGADQRRFHLHVPAGAVPKDGPSAGVTMTTALVSLLTGRPVRPEVGMTGEVTLQGRVLPIGGVKQKVLAAQRAGLTTVILPAKNGPDLDDLPEDVREAMTLHLVSDVTEVLTLALADPEEDATAGDEVPAAA
ncbi:MAG: endopeptidase La [Acidimicrobiales bacterium]|nr:endopeptidase La [Acidimicrobiales bacterium]